MIECIGILKKRLRMAGALNIRSTLIGSWRASKDRSLTEIYALIMALVHISLWEYGRETNSTRQGKRKTHFVEALHGSLCRSGHCKEKGNLQCPFVYSCYGK